MCRCRSCRICDNCWLLSLHQMSMLEHKFKLGCLKQCWKQKLGLRFGNVEQWTHPPLMCFINPCSTPGPGSVTMIWIVCQDIDGRPPGDAKGKATKGTYGPLNCREGYNNNLIMKPCLLKRSTPNTSRYWCPCNPGEVRVNRLDTAFVIKAWAFHMFQKCTLNIKLQECHHEVQHWSRSWCHSATRCQRQGTKGHMVQWSARNGTANN